jgi:4'-phosphopantetheinyl transferase
MASSDSVWRPATSAQELNQADAHVWLIRLDPSAQRLAALTPLLSADERRRAEAFQFAHLRQKYIAAHGALREVLACYTGQSPADIHFWQNAHGKPHLSNSQLQFNVSHSGDLALCAVADGRALGVDIEVIRPMDDLDAVAERFFSTQERAVLRTLDGDTKRHAFFACWTRKEAYIKAIGLGLAQRLDAFDVTLAPGEPARLLQVAGDSDASTRWAMFDLPVPDGYCGALIVETQQAHALRISYFAAP